MGMFAGIEIKIVNQGILPSGGNSATTAPPNYIVDWQYWSGAAWTSFRIISTDFEAPYSSHARESFDLGDYQYRFGAIAQGEQPFTQGSVFVSSTNPWIISANPPPGWAQTIVNGLNAFWIRAILTGPPSTTVVNQIPDIDFIKCHSSRLEINSDGYVERYGMSRTFKPSAFTFLPSDDDRAGSSDIFVSDNININNGAFTFSPTAIDTITAGSFIPSDACTSCSAVLRWFWAPSTGDTGNIQWTVRYAYSIPFSIDNGAVSSIYNTTTSPTTQVTEKQTTFTQQAPGTPDKLVSTFCRLDISDLVSDHGEPGDGDILWISLSRIGTAGPDTFTGTARVFTEKLYFVTLSDGQYLT